MYKKSYYLTFIKTQKHDLKLSETEVSKFLLLLCSSGVCLGCSRYLEDWCLSHTKVIFQPESPILNFFCLFPDSKATFRYHLTFLFPFITRSQVDIHGCSLPSGHPSLLYVLQFGCHASHSSVSCQGHWWPGLGKANGHILSDLLAFPPLFLLCPWPLLHLIC